MTDGRFAAGKFATSQCLLGAHLSIAGGLEKALYRAAALECSALQIFTKNASTWKERSLKEAEIDLFHTARAETGIRAVAAHTSYLINIATPDRKQRARSCAALEKEVMRATALQISDVVLHPGSHMGFGESLGLEKAAESLNAVLSKQPRPTARILLETTAGQGNSLGYRFEQIAALIDRVEDKSKIGVCLDTAHLYAAGYDIRTVATFSEVLRRFDTAVGFNYLKLLHLNDSKKDLGMRVDRHEHIGEGFIGLEAFRFVMQDSRLAAIPKIIETPKDAQRQDWDRKNLDRLRALLAD
ncbi:MAG: endonuclease IV [Deltaproteobacteria bacterium SG8_13]|nr:MAG: endonuclease IV [Deltaproteobacteria bacterium SG8_13]